MKVKYDIDIYSRTLYIMNSFKQFNKTRKDLGLEHQPYDQPCCYMYRSCFYIYVPKGSCLSSAVHECVHVAIDMLDSIHWKIDPDNQEPLAWLVDYIFRCYLDFQQKGRK